MIAGFILFIVIHFFMFHKSFLAVCLFLVSSTGSLCFAQQPKLMLPIGHTGPVYVASFSPDGKYILTASADGTAKVWNAISGQLLTDLAGNTSPIRSASFSPACLDDPTGGKYIVTGSFDNTAKVWNTVSGELVANMKEHTNLIRSVSFSPNGKYIVTASEDKTVKIWNAYSGQLVKNLTGFTIPVYTASFSPACPGDPTGGKYIVAAAWGQTAKVWNAVSGQFVTDLKGHTSIILSVAFSPDGKYIVTASVDGTAKVWNAVNGVLIANLKGHTDRVQSACFSPVCPDDPTGGKYIVTASLDKTAKVWNAFTGELVKDLIGHTGGLQSASFSPDGKYVVTASLDKTAKVWNPFSGNLIVDLKGHTNGVSNASFSPACADDPLGGKYIVTGSYDNTARMWNTINGQLIADMRGRSYRAYTASFSPDRKYILTVSSDSTAKIWNTVNGRFVTILKGHSNNVRTASFSPSCPDDSMGGKYIVTVSSDSTARVWNAVNGQLMTDLKRNADRVYKASFSPDGKCILTVSYDGTVKIWSAIGGQLITELKGHFNFVRSAFFSSDGKYIVTSNDKTAKVWNSVTGQLVTDLEGHTGVVQSASFSPDGKYIVTASDDSTAKIWETLSGRLVADLKGHTARLLRASFSSARPDDPNGGKYIITTSYDSTAKIWNAVSGQLVADLKGHTGYVPSASFSPDGKYIVTVSSDRTARVWNTVNWQLTKTIEGNGGFFGDIDFNNKRIICLYNSEVSIYDLENGKRLYTYFAVDSSDYLVYDKDNRYDGTPAARKLLYFTCGREIIELDQVKDQLWVPNLAERINKGESINARTLGELNICGLTPLMDVVNGNPDEYDFTIKPRRGGLGDINLSINGVLAETRKPEQLTKKGDIYEIRIIKNEFIPYLPDGQINTIALNAYTADNTISSGEITITIDKTQKPAPPPDLYAVMVGVSDYKGDAMDLDFAAIDATDISNALKDAAGKLLGKEHVFVYNLTTAKDHYLLPEKNSIKKVLKEIGEKAKANDILFIFLSGHGVMEGEGKKQFYYLTADASDFDAYAVAGISTTELTEWIKPQNIKAQKRVLILDACHSGQAINDFVTLGDGVPAAKGDDKGQQIKAIDKLNEKSGLFILSASASDKSAFESQTHSHGYLTYSLLKTIKEQPDILEDGKFLNISRWFNAAGNRVREVAKEEGVGQETQIVSNTDFNIGLVDEDVLTNIKFSNEKIMFSASNFQNNDEAVAFDDLDLTKIINWELVSFSKEPGSKFVFIMANNFPDACNLSGRYTVNGNTVTIKVNILQNKVIKNNFELSGTKDMLEELATNIVKKVAQWAESNK